VKNLKKQTSDYFNVITIPIIVMLVWSIIAFILGLVFIFLDVEWEVSAAAGLVVGFIGSVLGVLMALLVGFRTASKKKWGVSNGAIAGLLYGTVTSAMASGLAFLTSLFHLMAGKLLIPGLQGIPLQAILLYLGYPVVGFLETATVAILSLVYIGISILSGAILGGISAFASKKLLKR
jgi:hypothetical protein